LPSAKSRKGWQGKRKKYFKFFLRVKKKVVLLHPLNERIATQKRRHVHRHIELTARFEKRFSKREKRESKAN
jgi:hypothetical protein